MVVVDVLVVETVSVIVRDTMTVEVTPGGNEVIVVVALAVDVTVDVTGGRVVVFVVEAVKVIVFVVTVSKTSLQTTEVG